mmetsp:Transcript_1826/g.2944  ORF Transcript_1826/g.2944 Transcript_1826/m.2944 type:complete len:80 (-) Transcript_1826:296-535(-)
MHQFGLSHKKRAQVITFDTIEIDCCHQPTMQLEYFRLFGQMLPSQIIKESRKRQVVDSMTSSPALLIHVCSDTRYVRSS